MKKIALAGAAVLVAALFWGLFQTAEGWRRAGLVKHSSCTIPVELTEGAEKKPGGAFYKGPPPKTRKEMESMPEMEGSHHIHTAFFGGELFMAKNKFYHVETVFSEKCGLRVIFYNAFTEPINAKRFHAVALLIPDSVNKPFVGVVFLSPSADGSVLKARINHDLDDLLGAELYVKYPGIDEPEMFDIYLGDVSATE